MNTPQFSKGQTLTAEALNALAQNQRELAGRVGRAGLASRYVGPQQLQPVPTSTGSPAYLSPLAAPSSVAGVYLRQPWVEDVFSTQRTDALDLEKITRTDGSPLQNGDEIFQRVTVSDSGDYQDTDIEVFPSSSAPAPSDLWEPGSGSSVTLYRRLGSVIQDPRFATVDANGEPLPFRPLVVTHSDMVIPKLARNAYCSSSAVGLVGALTGSTIPVKQLVPGSGVTLWDAGSSVEINITGGSGSDPLAEAEWNMVSSVLLQSTVVGNIDGIVYDSSSVNPSAVVKPVLPYIANGKINLFPGILGFSTATASAVILPDVYTNGAQATALASFTVAGETRTLCAHYDGGFLSFEFR
jgi:hypothetical protein